MRSVYIVILQSQPAHPDANHNLGVLAVSMNKVDLSLPLFKTALEANPKIEQFWLSYIDALIKLNRITDAKAVFDEATRQGARSDGFDKVEEKLNLASKPTAKLPDVQDPPQNQLQLLIKLYHQRRFKIALQETSKLQIKHPSSILLYNILGAISKELGKPNKALEAYKSAMSIKPDHADAYNNICAVLRDQGKPMNYSIMQKVHHQTQHC